MKKQNRGGIVLIVFLILLCLLVISAIVWGIREGLQRLTEYGNSATIEHDPVPEEPESEVPEELPQEPSIPLNVYTADGFFERDGLKSYYSAGIEGIPGIDVSSHQQQIDWIAVRDAGVEFAMIQLGYRGYVSGELMLDEYYEQNMLGAAEAGIPVGVYFFSQALTEDEAIEEAEFVLQWIKDYEIAYPVVFDWEVVEADARTDEMNMVLLTACTDAFCRTIEAEGYEAGVYFNQVFGYEQLNLSSLQDYTFWLAEYREVPEFAYAFQMWQYTCEGTVPGINGPVDLNIAFRKQS